MVYHRMTDQIILIKKLSHQIHYYLTPYLYKYRNFVELNSFEAVNVDVYLAWATAWDNAPRNTLLSPMDGKRGYRIDPAP